MKRQFLYDITHRDGTGSSKKLWYNVACLTATGIIIWLAYELPKEASLEDTTFLFAFCIYLITVGGFEIILQIVKLIVQFKNGGATEKEKCEDCPKPKGVEDGNV